MLELLYLYAYIRGVGKTFDFGGGMGPPSPPNLEAGGTRGGRWGAHAYLSRGHIKHARAYVTMWCKLWQAREHYTWLPVAKKKKTASDRKNTRLVTLPG